MAVTPTLRSNVLPSGSAVIQSVSASGGTGGTWYQLIASTTTPIVALGYIGTTGTSQVVSLGTGAAGAEVVVRSDATGVTAGTYTVISFARPILIASGTRVAIRQATTGNNPALIYANASLLQ